MTQELWEEKNWFEQRTKKGIIDWMAIKMQSQT